MGYTVRAASGYRYTEYVTYNRTSYRGDWAAAPYGDTELYDYHTDPHETTNKVADPSLAPIVAELRGALLRLYAPTVEAEQS